MPAGSKLGEYPKEKGAPSLAVSDAYLDVGYRSPSIQDILLYAYNRVGASCIKLVLFSVLGVSLGDKIGARRR